MAWRLWVRIPEPYTGFTFFSCIFVVKEIKFFLKRLKNKRRQGMSYFYLFVNNLFNQLFVMLLIRLSYFQICNINKGSLSELTAVIIWMLFTSYSLLAFVHSNIANFRRRHGAHTNWKIHPSRQQSLSFTLLSHENLRVNSIFLISRQAIWSNKNTTYKIELSATSCKTSGGQWVTVWPDRIVKSRSIYPKVAQRVASTVLLKNDAFQNSPNGFSKYLGYFCNIIWCKEHSKTVQSGYTIGLHQKRFSMHVGQVSWSSGYMRRLYIERSSARIPNNLIIEGHCSQFCC